MKIYDFPDDIQPFLLPKTEGKLVYRCLGCNRSYGIDELLYTCPECAQVLLLQDLDFERLQEISGTLWHRIFDYRKMLNIPALKGIYRFHEFIGPMIPLDDIVCLGEGHTPMIEANAFLQDTARVKFYFKNDGQNPSASFKDRGMASALSYLNTLVRKDGITDILAVCASTGDTSAAAALYASYLQPQVKSAVLLPHKKVTPQQLSQPLGNGAAVFEIPGVFDDCMKVVEALSEQYRVALLNSKNAWRILGQESYSYEIAQDFEYELNNKVIVVPIGNAGNITAVMNGFIKFFNAGIITTLPKIIGVQSCHANPVYRYYRESDPDKREFVPVNVRSSVAQAAMIGNPVSMPRVIYLEQRYNDLSEKKNVFFVEVDEQSIMDWQLTANRNGHITCTHGGECLAGLIRARSQGIINSDEVAVIDATAHALKFSGFQDMYFEDRFPEEFDIIPKASLMNAPVLIRPADLEKVPAPGKPLSSDDFELFVKRVSAEIAEALSLRKINPGE
ncbi:MAG: threonine synthase [Deltaproteobacteria bacterium]|nr:threonine synthase [Deltaproteobacteria bacterium]